MQWISLLKLKCDYWGTQGKQKTCFIIYLFGVVYFLVTPRELEIIVTVVVDSLDKFGGLSVLQTLGSFLVHLQFIVVV